MASVARFATYSAVAVATAATIVTVGVTFASAGRGDTSPTDDQSVSLVEDYAYPGADAILAEKRIKLVSGDGHILLADCSTPPSDGYGLIIVGTTTSGATRFCFKVTGNKGQLDLELPAVYEIRGDGIPGGQGHNITAVIDTAIADPTTIQINPNGNTPVGVGDPNSNQPTTLLQLKVTP